LIPIVKNNSKINTSTYSRTSELNLGDLSNISDDNIEFQKMATLCLMIDSGNTIMIILLYF